MTLLASSGLHDGAVPLADRGLAYGDGLFETMAVLDGRIRLLPFHLQRLESGLRRLGIHGLAFGEVADSLRDAAVRSRAVPGCSAACIMKFVVTRGDGPRGYAPPRLGEPRWWLQAFPWLPPTAERLPAKVVVSGVRLGHQPLLAGLKHLNRLEQVLARQQVPPAEADELLLFDTEGRLVCATAANVFIVRGDRLCTPRLERCGVAGVARAALLAASANGALDCAVEEGELGRAELDTADEVFLTSALRGVWPVKEIDGRPLPGGEVVRRLEGWWSTVR